MSQNKTFEQNEQQKLKKPTPILIGSTFPISKIRRRVVVTPQTVTELRSILKTTPHISFWGHQNTIEIARHILGVDLTPRSPRPILELDSNGYPMLEETSFKTCWLLSPEYVGGIRPAIGEEVGLNKIDSWHVLKLEWA